MSKWRLGMALGWPKRRCCSLSELEKIRSLKLGNYQDKISGAFFKWKWSHSVMSDSLWPLWTVAYHAPLFMGFSRQKYWRGLPFPSPEDLPNPGIKFTSLISTCIGRQVLYHQHHLGITGIHVGTQNRVTKKKYIKEYHYHIIFIKLHFPNKSNIGDVFKISSVFTHEEYLFYLTN